MGAGAPLPCVRCGKEATLRCPKCIEVCIPEEKSSFCSQECFKGGWAEHKGVHTDPTQAWLYCMERGASRAKTMPAFDYRGPLRPYPIAPPRTVPDSVPRPDYAVRPDGYPAKEMESKQQRVVAEWSGAAVDAIRQTCRKAREVLDEAHRAVRPGVTTDEIDRVVHDAVVERGGYPSPLNYFNFPKSVCTSVNEVICHGIPDRRELQDGDIINVDVTVYYGGFHGDLNETFCVGKVDDKSRRLIKCAHDCLMKAIQIVRPGTRYRDVGDVISQHAKSEDFSVVRAYCGHGVGDLFHCAPNVPHYAGNKAVGLMKPGHVFTIEPMINEGSWRDVMWPDGWTSTTTDGKRSAQFEHQLLVTETGVEVLTARLPDSPPLWWEVDGASSIAPQWADAAHVSRWADCFNL